MAASTCLPSSQCCELSRSAFVVILLGFFNEAFQADLETNLVAVLVKCQQGELPRYSAVAVPERVDAKKIQDEGGDGDERRDILLVKGVLVMLAESFYSRFGVSAAFTQRNRTTGACPGRNSTMSLSTRLNWPASPLADWQRAWSALQDCPA